MFTDFFHITSLLTDVEMVIFSLRISAFDTAYVAGKRFEMRGINFRFITYVTWKNDSENDQREMKFETSKLVVYVELLQAVVHLCSNHFV